MTHIIGRRLQQNFLQAFSGVYLTSGDVRFRVNGYLMDEGKLAVLCLLRL